MPIVRGLRMLRVGHVTIGKGTGLVVGLGLQKLAGLFCCHQVHVATCMPAHIYISIIVIVIIVIIIITVIMIVLVIVLAKCWEPASSAKHCP